MPDLEYPDRRLAEFSAGNVSLTPCDKQIMLNPTSLLADALGRNLAETYRRIYGDREPHVAAALDEAARLV